MKRRAFWFPPCLVTNPMNSCITHPKNVLAHKSPYNIFFIFCCRLLIFFSQTTFFAKFFWNTSCVKQFGSKHFTKVSMLVLIYSPFSQLLFVVQYNSIQYNTIILLWYESFKPTHQTHVTKLYFFSISTLRNYKLKDSHAQNLASCQEPIFQHNHSKLTVCRLTSIHYLL